MSGTSCDGLDIAYCSFKKENDNWSFKLLNSASVDYNNELKQKLYSSYNYSATQLKKLDIDLGNYFGEEVSKFIEEYKLNTTEIDFIASHGHTIFHNPTKGYTLQIGNGNNIKAKTSITTIFDFRSMDVSLGGQGAPLVPVGDELLFSEYDYCINIGGIANTSFNEKGMRKAFDICFANMGLNPLANKLNLPFDRDGEIAQKNTINTELLNDLTSIDLKNISLSTETYLQYVEPIIVANNDTIENKIATLTEYLALKINKSIKPNSRVLLTGGGALNKHLVSRVKELTSAEIIIPSKEIIEFKEAILFGFLGVLKSENIPNCLASVTGASQDNVGGVLV
jgi:anhydro-N-acetylmuramic acid kinase